MSMAEFYIENGIDPTDPDHMDNFLSRQYERDPSPPRRQFFSGVVIARIKDDSSSRTAASSWPLNESELDYMGDTRGWEKIEGLPAQPPMASYKKDGIRLNFWLSTGTVGSYLDHPRQGKTQLFRREISMSEASDIFNNPRQHTGKGYHHKNEKKVVPKKKNRNGPRIGPHYPRNHKHTSKDGIYFRKCAQCGNTKPNGSFTGSQRRKGTASRCKACVV